MHMIHKKFEKPLDKHCTLMYNKDKEKEKDTHHKEG